MFKLPSGYDCIQVYSGGSLISARKYGSQDTYALNGFDWVQIDHADTSHYSSSCSYNYPGQYFVPGSIQAFFVLPTTNTDIADRKACTFNRYRPSPLRKCLDLIMYSIS